MNRLTSRGREIEELGLAKVKVKVNSKEKARANCTRRKQRERQGQIVQGESKDKVEDQTHESLPR